MRIVRAQEGLAPAGTELHPPVLYTEPAEDARVFGGTRNLLRAAARAFGVDLSPQEDYDWQVEIGAAMLVDHLVDVERRDITPYFSSIINGNIRSDLAEDVQIRAINYAARKSPEERARILAEVELINTLIATQRQSTKAKEVIDIRITEADIMARLFALDIVDDKDLNAREAFNMWVHGFSRTGYLFDTFIDARADYEAGESSVVPTAINKTQYFSTFSSEGMRALRKTPPSLIGQCALTAVNYVVRGMQRDVTEE